MRMLVAFRYPGSKELELREVDPTSLVVDPSRRLTRYSERSGYRLWALLTQICGVFVVEGESASDAFDEFVESPWGGIVCADQPCEYCQQRAAAKKFMDQNAPYKERVEAGRNLRWITPDACSCEFGPSGHLIASDEYPVILPCHIEFDGLVFRGQLLPSGEKSVWTPKKR